jgi:tetratricopeptide (TPR) repeat protein
VRTLALLLPLMLLGANSARGGVMEVRQAAFLLKKQQPQAAEEMLRRLLHAEPRNALAHQVLAASFMARGRLDSSLVHYSRAIQYDSSFAEAYNGLGIAFAYGHQYVRAISALSRAADLDAGQPAFFYNAGVVYERLANLDQACQAYQAAVRLDPRNAETRRALGSVFMGLGKPQEAAGQYEEACRLDPQGPANWYGAGKAHVRLKQDSLAILCLERARALGDDGAGVLYQLGLLYGRAGREEAAERVLGRFRQLAAENPKPAKRVELKMTDPDAARNQGDLGTLFAQHGRPAAARVRLYRAKNLGLTQQEQALPLPPGSQDPTALERLAGTEAMQHQEYRLAASHFRAAVRLEPGNPLNHRNLRQALHSLRRTGGASQAYREPARLDP